MNHLGYISIQGDKIVFVYYELPKPIPYNVGKYVEFTNKYVNEMKEYEASKREVEVENATKPVSGYCSVFLKDENSSFAKTINVGNNQPCKAEVIDNKATIIKIT